MRRICASSVLEPAFPFRSIRLGSRISVAKTHGVTVDYQAKGSGAGIQDLINKTVDFAASDAAMTPEQIAKVADGVVLLPMTAGEIVLAYNLPGQPKDLKLPRDVYPDIFAGKITNWDDPRIVAANPDIKLPDLPITVVRRSDSSGTTFVFTKHLSAISPAFKEQVGSGTTRQLAAERQIRRRAEERRRDRDHQADPRRDRLHRIRLCEADQGRHRAAAE